MNKFTNKSDIELSIQILKRAIENTKDTYTGKKIIPSLNRVIFELEELMK